MIKSGNPDGFGAMWHNAEEGRVNFVKSNGTLEQKLELYESIMDKGDLGIHVRHATHGAKDEENCHPYCVLSKDLGHKMDLYMMHNGTISDVQVEKNMSDSYNFAVGFLRPFLEKRPEIIHDRSFQYLLSGMIGDRNKLLFLDSKGRWLIINSSAGTMQNGIWVSNKTEIKPYVEQTFHASHQTKTKNGSQPGPEWQGPVVNHTSVKYPKTDGEWEMGADGRSHWITHPKNREGSEPSSDDKEGHTQPTAREGTGPTSAQSVSDSSGSQKNNQDMGGRRGEGRGGIIPQKADSISLSFSSRNAAWTPAKGYEPENFVDWGELQIDTTDVAKKGKREILQLVLESPFEVTDLLFKISRDLVTTFKYKQMGMLSD